MGCSEPRTWLGKCSTNWTKALGPVFVSWDKVSLCSPGWPGSLYEVDAGLYWYSQVSCVLESHQELQPQCLLLISFYEDISQSFPHSPLGSFMVLPFTNLEHVHTRVVNLGHIKLKHLFSLFVLLAMSFAIQNVIKYFFSLQLLIVTDVCITQWFSHQPNLMI